MRKLTKLTAVLVVVAALIALSAAPVLAVKPTGNLAGAEKVAWNLSGAVMSVPPWGLQDIPGSDTASKLIVNQPNGQTEVAITGAMNGLAANSTYTVYLAKGYTAKVPTGWNVAGTWEINVEYLGIDYPETLILTQTGTDITGVSLNTIPPASGSAFTIIGGSVTDNNIEIDADHDVGSLVVHLSGIIAGDGSMSGNWYDIAPGSRTGTWSSTSGAAVETYSSTSWPGLFNASAVPTFTFTTDEFGAGSWHINLRDAVFNGSETYELSIWINVPGVATILISDNFEVVVD